MTGEAGGIGVAPVEGIAGAGCGAGLGTKGGGITGFGEKGAGWGVFCLVNSSIKLSMVVDLVPWSSDLF